MRPGLSGQHRPPKSFRVRQGANAALEDFETLGDVHKEWDHRIAAIRRRIKQTPAGRRRQKLVRLLARLRKASSRRHGSLANPLCMHRLRKGVSGHLWLLVDRTRGMKPVTCTLIPWRWEVPAGQLRGFDPVKALAALRRLINSYGGDRASGYFIAFIDGTYEPRRQVYVLHLHCLVAGGMRAVIDGPLRACPTFAVDRSQYGVSEWVSRRVRFDPGLRDLPRQLTYMVKSYWPEQWQGLIDGKVRRGRKVRIKEPQHTEVLLWLNRWRLNDIALLMNVRAGRDGLVLAKRAYTNDSKS